MPLFDTFSVGKPALHFIGLRLLHSLHPMLMLSVAFGDKHGNRVETKKNLKCEFAAVLLL